MQVSTSGLRPLKVSADLSAISHLRVSVTVQVCVGFDG